MTFESREDNSAMSLFDPSNAGCVFRAVGDIAGISTLGHFLKGSSATLGLTQVKDQCERVQHLGGEVDAGGDKKKVLREISQAVDQMKKDFIFVDGHLRRWYDMPPQ